MADSSHAAFAERLAKHLSSHHESLLSVFVSEMQTLRAENEELRRKLLACEQGLHEEGDSCVPPRCESSKDQKMEPQGPVSLEGPTVVDIDQLSPNSDLQILPAGPASQRSENVECNGANSEETEEASNTNPRDSGNGVQALEEQKAAKKSDRPDEKSFLFLGTYDHQSSRTQLFCDGENIVHSKSMPAVQNCRRFIFSSTFECISAFVIVMNALVMALKLQYAGFDHAYKLHGPSYSRPAQEVWPWGKAVFQHSDLIFNTLFIIELALRVWAMRRAALTSRWIWYDTIIVTLGILDSLSSGGVGVDPSMMRIIRLARTVRLLKVFQAMSRFDSLILLIKSLQASRQAAIWSFLVLGMVQLIVGLFICQYVQDYLEADDENNEYQKRVYRYYGSFSRTLLTTYEVTFGNWSNSCRVLMDYVGEWFSVFYIAYRCLFLFAVLKVIAAVFITETNRVLDHDDELTIIKANRDMTLFQRSYKKLVARVDRDHDGMLSWTELEELLMDPQMKNMLPTIGFDKNDLLKLFWLIEDDCGSVSVDDFFAKLCKLKGPAKKINEMTMLKLVHKIHTMMLEVWEKQGLLEEDMAEEFAEEQAVQS